MQRAKRRQRILVVDGHCIMREATVRWITDQPGWKVCGETGSARGTFKAVEKLRPDLLIVELIPPRDFNFIGKLRQRFPRLRILVFTAMESSFARQARDAGANAFVSKHLGPEKLILKARGLLRAEHRSSRRGGAARD